MEYKLYHGDCLEIMKEIPDESIDMILTDPPYLMNYKTNRRKDKNHIFCQGIYNDKTTDSNIIADSIKQFYRILKKDTAIYLFCNSNKIDIFKQELEKNGFKIKNIIIWVKNNRTAGDLKAQFGKQYEFIILANKGRKEFYGKRITDVWTFKRVAGKTQLHPNQKPLELLQQAIEYHSKKGDTILDSFMGSGSTGVACVNTERNFIGIELEKNYFDIAQERISKANKEC